MESEAVISDYIISKQLQGVCQSTLRSYEHSIDRLKKVWPDVAFLDTKTLRQYFATIPNDVTRSIHIKNLRVLYRWMVAEGYREDEPMVRIPNPRIPQVFPKTVSDDDIKALIKTAKKSPRDLAIVLLLLDTGLRASELGSLERDDVDIDNRTLLVRVGKGRKSRMVYFSILTARALRRHLAHRKDTDPALFLSERYQPINRDSLRHLTYRLSDRAGIKRVSPHMLRHTFATQYVASGGDPFSLQRIMGHADNRIAMRYVHLNGGDVQAAHSRHSPVERVLR